MSAPTEPKSRKRKKNTTDLGKRIMQRERQRLAQEQAALAEEMAKAARESRRIRRSGVSPSKKQRSAIDRGIVKRVAGVLASEGVNASVHTEVVDDTAQVNAWTDFRNIHVGYHMHDDVRLTAAVLRGLLYHEGGHCRWTVPFVDLKDMVATELGSHDKVSMPFDERTMHYAWNALEDQRMETAVTNDSPRKAGYFVPVILSELAADVNAAQANWPLMVGRRYLPKHIRDGARKLFVTRHNLVGLDGEALAVAIEQTVRSYIAATKPTTMWQAVCDMAELLQRIQPMTVSLDDMTQGHQNQRRKGRKADPDALQIPVTPGDCQGDDDEEEPEIDPTNPIVAQHLALILSKMLLEPETLIQIQYVSPSASEDEGGQSGAGQPGQDGGKPKPSKGDTDKDTDKDNSEADKDSTPGSDADSEGTGKDTGKDTDESEGDGSNETGDDEEGGHQGGTSGTHTDDGSDATQGKDLTDEDLADAIDQAEEDRMADSSLDGDVEAFHDAMNAGDSIFETYEGGTSTDAAAHAEAMNLAQDIENAFHAATVNMQPDWHEQQRRGIVNPLRYRTRRPGEHEFFRAFVDEGTPGFDLSVSLLLDYSGSMSRSCEALAKVALASKAACQNLGIPCTVTLWDTQARLLFDANERVDHLPVIQAAGGTDPAVALSDLDNQRQGKAKHIVIVMTDGQWSGDTTMAAYGAEGRIMIGLGYAHGQSSESIVRSMHAKGFDEGYAIKDLHMIPTHLERALVEHA